jgi:hypothetical protein
MLINLCKTFINFKVPKKDVPTTTDTLNKTEATPMYASFFIVEMSLLNIKGSASKITPILIKIRIRFPIFYIFFTCTVKNVKLAIFI